MWVKGVGGLGEWLMWGVVALGLLGVVAVALLASDVLPVVIGAPVLLLVLAITGWQVRVDSRGLTAAGAFGWPRLHVPADEVEGAHVVEINPLRQFGGWGLRTNRSGAVGVVIRRGEAIAVDRSGARRTVVTVDDAATGAALLNTYGERARRHVSDHDDHTVASD